MNSPNTYTVVFQDEYQGFHLITNSTTLTLDRKVTI